MAISRRLMVGMLVAALGVGASPAWAGPESDNDPCHAVDAPCQAIDIVMDGTGGFDPPLLNWGGAAKSWTICRGGGGGLIQCAGAFLYNLGM
ncbi:MAG: hypothetical protein WDA27_09545 [Actinomycetota bacterium]